MSLRSARPSFSILTHPRKVAPQMVAPHESPGDLHGFCGGKDELDRSCRCPEPTYVSKLRLVDLKPFASRILCGCCELPFPSADPPA